MTLPLESLQAGFAAALADAGALAPIEAELVAGPGAGRVRERFALYRGNVAAAGEGALANAFPVVRRLVGAEFFATLARAYGREQASASGDLNQHGGGLATFIAGFEPARPLPYLADVAALEWALHRAHYAADAGALSRERIAALSAAELLAARFALHPACAWIESAFPVASLWRAHQPGSGVERLALDRAQAALVVRPLWRAEALVSSAGEIAALARVRDGGDMEAAIAAGLQADAAFDFPKALVRWIDHAVLVDREAA